MPATEAHDIQVLVSQLAQTVSEEQSNSFSANLLEIIQGNFGTRTLLALGVALKHYDNLLNPAQREQYLKRLILATLTEESLLALAIMLHLRQFQSQHIILRKLRNKIESILKNEKLSKNT